MSRAVDALLNLRDINRKELRANVTNVLLQAILEQLEQVNAQIAVLVKEEKSSG